MSIRFDETDCRIEQAGVIAGYTALVELGEKVGL